MVRIIIILLLLTSAIVSAQESKKYLKNKENINYREGYIVDKQGSKTYGLIKDKYGASRNFKIEFISKEGVKKIYYPYEIAGFGVSIYRYVSDNKLFLEVVREGRRISLYKVEFVSSSVSPGFGPSGPMVYGTENMNYYVKRHGEETYKLVERRKFKEEFSNYFSDCEALKAKIENGEFTHKEIEKIVSMYNYECE